MPEKNKSIVIGARNENIDFLRAIGCIAVVILHVNAWCFNVDKLSIGASIGNVLINTLVRFAVPCFMIITGTFIFDNADKYGWRVFYKRAVNKILSPTLYFSVLYVAYTIFKGLLEKENVVNESLAKWVQGIPFGHMWYMYMLIGFYVVVPVLCRIRNNVSRQVWASIGLICLLASAVCFNGNLIAPNWAICWIQYVGYFIIGDICGGGQKSKKNVKCVKYAKILCGLSIALMCIYSLNALNLGLRFNFQPQNILTATFAISLYFIVYNSETIYFPKTIRLIAIQSSNIYFIHGLIVNIVVIIMNRLQWQYKIPICFTIIASIFVLACSYYYGIFHSYCIHLIRKKIMCTPPIIK